MRAERKIILEQHDLAVEHEVQVRIAVEAVEHRIDRVEQPRPVGLERAIPLAVPVKVRDEEAAHAGETCYTQRMPPVTRYAKRGGINIAYQVMGDGPFDVVFVPGFVSHLDYFWEIPTIARVWQRLASFARLITFDKRGAGLSERTGGIPTLEERMDDLNTVMDAVGSKRAALIGISEGGTMCINFAATHPERTIALVLWGSFAKV